jgi:hypothetical protein
MIGEGHKIHGSYCTYFITERRKEKTKRNEGKRVPSKSTGNEVTTPFTCNRSVPDCGFGEYCCLLLANRFSRITKWHVNEDFSTILIKILFRFEKYFRYNYPTYSILKLLSNWVPTNSQPRFTTT